MLPPGLVAALAPGSVINGKYRIERALGIGGMGVVVAARHVELNQTLAIKVLLPSAASSEESTTRFLREGRSAAQLTSPHVAKVHDTGRLPTGEPYLVMELLRGRDLRALINEVRRVPMVQSIDWVLQAAHALAEAHSLKIIHRDVKPANLFLAETSAGQQIKVLDFGISKQLDSNEAELTNTSSAVGTPRYMAPEQMRSARFADARGDIWSLGIVLYELTTGRSPFQGDSVTALCFDVMERTPLPPSQHNSELPAAFDAVIDRCLKKDPEERFQSMEALSAALQALVPGIRTTGQFNIAALTQSGPVPGITPIPMSTPDPAGSTRREPVTGPHKPFPATVTFQPSEPLFPEPLHQETMRAWNTTAVPRPAAKSQRMHLVALGVGIGVASAALIGMLFIALRHEPEAATQRVEINTANLQPTTTLTATATAPPSAAPVPTVVASAAPVPTASASEQPSAKVAPPPLPPPPPRKCDPPYTMQKGIKIPKPECLN